MLDVKLKTLLTVYKEMSFTKAAAKLALTQPAVSNHINLLESQLGCKLCRREKGKLTFTPEGETAVKYAMRFDVMYKSLHAEILEEHCSPKHIRIGLTRAAESDLIVLYAIGQYISDHSDVTVKIFSNDVQKLYEMLENYELDIVIAEKKPVGEHFGSRLLDRDNLVCVVDKNNPISSKKSITLEELKKERLIIRGSSSNIRMLFESTLESINESINNFNVVLEVDSVSAIMPLIKRGVGVSIMPEKSCHHDLEHSTYVAIPIENMNIIRELHMGFREDFAYTDILNDLYQNYKDNISD